jgi:hypothetical protein
VALSHDEYRNCVKPPVLVFSPFLLVRLIPERNRLHVGNVSVEPLVAPKAPENDHPAYPILTRGNFVESASTRNEFPIKKTVDGFFQIRDHHGGIVQAV